jgi:hypothetical protein
VHVIVNELRSLCGSLRDTLEPHAAPGALSKLEYESKDFFAIDTNRSSDSKEGFMSITLNHTTVPAKDKDAAAKFFT